MELLEVGTRFFPTDEEVMQHLRNKIENPRYRHRAIVETDLYKQEPWCLPRNSAENKLFRGNERYFFHKRKALYGKATAKKTKRTVEKDGVVVGHWHGNAGYKDILKGEGGPAIGFVSSLTYFIRDKERPEGKGIKTDWIMHEYVVDVRNAQEWSLYRIRCNGKGPFMAAANSTGEFDGSKSEASTVVSGGGSDPLLPSKRRKIDEEYTSPRPLLLSSYQEVVQEEISNMAEEGISVDEEFWKNIGDLEEPEVLKILESALPQGFEEQEISMSLEALEAYSFDLDIEAPPPPLLDLEYITKPVETDQALVVKNRELELPLKQQLEDQYTHPEGCSGDHGHQQRVEDDFLENLNSELLSSLMEGSSRYRTRWVGRVPLQGT